MGEERERSERGVRGREGGRSMYQRYTCGQLPGERREKGEEREE